MNRRRFFQKASRVLAGLVGGCAIVAPVSASVASGGGDELTILKSEIELLKAQLVDAQRVQLMFDEDLDIARGDIANLYTGYEVHEDRLDDLTSRHCNPTQATMENKEMSG